MVTRIFILVLLGYAAPIAADTPRLLDLDIRGVAISVEVADTPETRARGLMNRKHLAKDRGMLFIFAEPGYHSMWMANTYVPLSVAFVDAHGKILNIDDMAPLTQDAHGPSAPAKYVLETIQGWFKTHNIKAGDLVHGLCHAPAGR